MNGLGDAPIAGDDFAVEPVDQLLIRPVCGVGGVLFGDDEPGATFGSSGVVRGVLFSGQPVGRVVGEMGTEHQAIAHCDRAQPQWREEISIAAHTVLSVARRRHPLIVGPMPPAALPGWPHGWYVAPPDHPPGRAAPPDPNRRWAHDVRT